MPTANELAFDWIGHFTETLPSIRNNYAHGSTSLHATVLRTFEVTRAVDFHVKLPRGSDFDAIDPYKRVNSGWSSIPFSSRGEIGQVCREVVLTAAAVHAEQRQVGMRGQTVA